MLRHRLHTMKSSRILEGSCLGLLIGALPMIAQAQCGPYMHHPVWPDTLGYAYVNLVECSGNVTSCEWDNGSTDALTYLGPGGHSVTFFDGLTPLNTLTFQIDQVPWQLYTFVYGPQQGVIVENTPSLQYCPSQIFNNLSCPPVPDSTVLYLLQDGIIIDSITPIDCYGGNYSWNGLPFGHVYQTYLLDHSHCGSYMYSSSTQSYTSDGAEMMITVQDAVGGTNGSILVQEVVPGPLSLMPPPSPIVGSLSLLEWPSMNLLYNEPSVTTVEWDGLTPGQYLLVFAPDSICAALDTVLTVGNSTGISDALSGTEERLFIWPQPADVTLYWSAKSAARFRVYDAQGRMVRTGPDHGVLDMSDLPSGPYHLEVIAGIRRWRARFLKE